MSCYKKLIDVELGCYPTVLEVIASMKRYNVNRVEGVILAYSRKGILHVTYGHGVVTLSDLQNLPPTDRVGDMLQNFLDWFNNTLKATTVYDESLVSVKTEYMGFVTRIFMFPSFLLFVFVLHCQNGATFYQRLKNSADSSHVLNAFLISCGGYFVCMKYLGIISNIASASPISAVVGVFRSHVGLLHYFGALFAFITGASKENIATIALLNIFPYVLLGVIMRAEPESIQNFAEMITKTAEDSITFVSTIRSAFILHGFYTLYDCWFGFLYNFYGRNPVVGVVLIVGMATIVPTSLFF